MAAFRWRAVFDGRRVGLPLLPTGRSPTEDGADYRFRSVVRPELSERITPRIRSLLVRSTDDAGEASADDFGIRQASPRWLRPRDLAYGEQEGRWLVGSRPASTNASCACASSEIES